MKAQLTLSVNCGKWLIATAIISMPEFQKALHNGKVILKGGTTVSCIAEKLLGVKLRICGRITKRGAVANCLNSNAPHSILIENNKWQNIDNCFMEKALNLGSEDVTVIGANAIDAEGNAVMMAGSPGGGNPGKAISAMAIEGSKVIIAAGIEKLIPGKISDVINKVSRKDYDYSMGMACGLIPLYGQIITEMEALNIIAGVDAKVIGRGGIDGAEGSTTVLIEGDEYQLKKAIKEVIEDNSKPISGDEESLKECKPGSPGCSYHLSCVYSRKNKLKI